MGDIEYVKSLLTDGGYTCVLSDGDKTFTSRERGVKPLLAFIDSGESFVGFVAADKVVGKAAAMLYALMGVNRLYAHVMTEQATAVCRRFGIEPSFGTLADKVINRKGDGICPMEQAVADTDEPEQAKRAIIAKLKML